MRSPDSSARSPRRARRWGASTWSRASGGWRNSVKFDDTADPFAACEVSESLVDVVEPQAARDERIEQHTPRKVFARDPRKIARRPRVAVARADDALLTHQRSPAERHVLVHVDLAQPHDFAARTYGFHRELKRVFAARGFEDVVGAASIGELADSPDDVGIGRRYRPGGAKPLRCSESRSRHIDGDDLARIHEPCALDGVESHCAAADHGDTGTRRHSRFADYGADAGHHPAADEACAIER